MTITRIRHLTTAGYSPTGDVAPPAPPCGRGFLHRRALIQNEGPPKWLIVVLPGFVPSLCHQHGGYGGGRCPSCRAENHEDGVVVVVDAD